MFIQQFLFFIIFKYFATCFQTQYVIVPHHCESLNHNKTLLNYFTYKCDKRSRTELYMSVNHSLRFNVPSDEIEQVKITGYVFRNNIYIKGPIEFMMGYCTLLKSKDFDIPHIFGDSNMKCPLKKNTNYYIRNAAPNATNMPPFIPPGDWMFELSFMYLNKYTVVSVRWYIKIEYPILPSF